MIAAWVLFAADWTQLIIWVVIISVGLLNQLFGANKKKPPQMPRQPGAGGAGGAAPGQKTLLDEVEKFLQEARKATSQSHTRPPQQQPRPQQQPQQQQRPQQQVARPLPTQQKQPKQPGKRKNQQASGQQPPRKDDKQPQRRTLAEQSRLKPQESTRELDEVRLGGNVGQHVQEHLNTNRFAERAGRLSHLQQTVDTDIGGHVHTVFDHQVGSLKEGSAAGSTTNDTPTGPNQVVQLIAMFADPMSMRNAVLIREILEPPTHRW
ncbi:MAG: hypothetical protein K8U03_18365 [Planctomycetia bacterium]|nr:hypothetical protein [Planctomycetia bacterium]